MEADSPAVMTSLSYKKKAIKDAHRFGICVLRVVSSIACSRGYLKYSRRGLYSKLTALKRPKDIYSQYLMIGYAFSCSVN